MARPLSKWIPIPHFHHPAAKKTFLKNPTFSKPIASSNTSCSFRYKTISCDGQKCSSVGLLQEHDTIDPPNCLVRTRMDLNSGDDGLLERSQCSEGRMVDRIVGIAQRLLRRCEKTCGGATPCPLPSTNIYPSCVGLFEHCTQLYKRTILA